MLKQTLYGLDKAGKHKIWTITAEDDTVTIEHGKVGGKIQTKVEVISVGKQGRTIAQQADLVAKSKIKVQLDKGYRETVEELESLPLLAMLAKTYSKWKGEGWGSFKYDGQRCLVKLVDGFAELESRTGQPLDVPHLREELTMLMRELNSEYGITSLDGEIYLHGECLQDIVSAVGRTDTQAEIDKCHRRLQKLGTQIVGAESQEWLDAKYECDQALLIHNIRPKLQFIAFDVPDESGTIPFSDRIEMLAEVSAWTLGYDHLFVCHYEKLKTEADLFAFHKLAVEEGYEGAMYRTADGVYESGKRSTGLQKYKTFLDKEFKVVGYEFDKDGGIVYVCQNDLKDNTFNVVMGELDERKANARIADHFVDIEHWLTTQYQSRYKKTLLPQFPTGKLLRQGKSIGGVFVPSE